MTKVFVDPLAEYLQYIPEDKQAAFKSALGCHTVNVLNEALARDPIAMQTLMNVRVPCDPALGTPLFIYGDSEYHVSVLGLLNGLLNGDAIILPHYSVTKQLNLFTLKELENGEDGERQENEDQ